MNEPLAETLRIEGGRVVATLIRLTGDFAIAEDAVQDAVIQAMETWPERGVPANPAAWLTTVARNKALDRLRREGTRDRKEREAALRADLRGEGLFGGPLDRPTLADDMLRLLFTCCHPALASEARLALALRTIVGLTTAEIAAVSLVPEATIAQRITRAKKKITAARIPYRVPDDHELPERLPTVLATIYAVFTIGDHSTVGAADRRLDLASEGVRLARLVVELMPDVSECAGLLALTLAVHARRPARIDARGDVVLMADQDRTRWDHEMIAEAAALVERTLRRPSIGPYQLQAAIACLHGLAPSYPETDWAQIAQLYEALEQLQPTPVVRVNRAIAVREASSAADALVLLDELDERTVATWHLYWATRADLLHRSGDRSAAREALRRASQCSCNDADRRLLEARLASW